MTPLHFMQVKIFFAFVILLTCGSLVGATTVERSGLVAREPGVFTTNIRAVLNTRTNESLVIWLKTRVENNSIWGRLLQADGRPSGGAFQIVSGPNALLPDLTFNPDTNQFLLMYSNEIGSSNRFEVRVQRLNSSGRKSGPSLRVSSGSDTTKNINNFSSRLIYDSASQGYLVLLTRNGTASEDGLYGTVLNSNLTVRTPLVLMAPAIKDGPTYLGPNVTDLKFHSPSGKILAAGYSIVTGGGFAFQYFVSKIDPSLQKPKITLTKLKGGTSAGAAPDAHVMLLPDGNAIGLFVEGTGLRKRKINQLGAPIGPISFFYSGVLQSIPVEFPVSATTTDEVAVVSIEDSTMMTGKIWLQTTSPTGALTQDGFSLQSDQDTNGRPAIVALPAKPSNGFLYAVIYMEGGQVFPPSPTASSGLILLRVNTTP
ncbi:MAG TPA: hypothetical protein VLH08_15700 [Acidobacteriota bacterium]|nr:hypothetical protein [Acidobacteriota bacterium]